MFFVENKCLQSGIHGPKSCVRTSNCDLTNMSNKTKSCNLKVSNIWSQTVPHEMPWALCAYSDAHSSAVIRFTANEETPFTTPDPCTSRTAIQCQNLKRRNCWDDDHGDDVLKQPPIKQYISEERVAAEFNALSISSNDNGWQNGLNDEGFELSDEECEENNETSVFICEEVKKTFSAEDTVQRFLKEELEKMSKAVVLWKPMPTLIDTLCTVTTNECPKTVLIDEQVEEETKECDMES